MTSDELYKIVSELHNKMIEASSLMGDAKRNVKHAEEIYSSVESALDDINMEIYTYECFEVSKIYQEKKKCFIEMKLSEEAIKDIALIQNSKSCYICDGAICDDSMLKISGKKDIGYIHARCLRDAQASLWPRDLSKKHRGDDEHQK